MRHAILAAAAFAAAVFLGSSAFAQHLSGPSLAACASKRPGQACSVNNGQPYTGVCTVLSNGTDLGCLPAVCAVCGDGFVTPEAGEQCDPGPAGFTGLCNINCTISACGDGIVNPAAGEQCDPGASIVTPTCNYNCTVSRCGDGIVNAAAFEVCDDGAETASCTARCTFSACGDGYVNHAAGEECDTGGIETDTCTANCKLKR